VPFTPYHFGPSGFFGLLLRRWIDPFVFVAANIIVDVEVLFAAGVYPHRHWHLHSWLVGAGLGAAFGASLYLIKPIRRLISQAMDLLRIRYKPGLIKMTVAGALGVCFHVLIDGLYHYDVQPLFPHARNPLWRWLYVTLKNQNGQADIRLICLLFFIPAIIVYRLAVRSYNKQKSPEEIADAEPK
jgi:hypothetical protein